MRRRNQRAIVLNRIKKRCIPYKRGTMEEQEEGGF